jgi:hypothetical protein
LWYNIKSADRETLSGAIISDRIVAVKSDHAQSESSAKHRACPRQLLCTGTLIKRMKSCGSPSCRCAHDPAARHGPYYEWGHMQAGKLVHRVVSAEQAQVLQGAIANYRKLKKLLRGWEAETERLIDATASSPVRPRRKHPRDPRPGRENTRHFCAGK